MGRAVVTRIGRVGNRSAGFSLAEIGLVDEAPSDPGLVAPVQRRYATPTDHRGYPWHDAPSDLHTASG
jgi:hypothetical protein